MTRLHAFLAALALACLALPAPANVGPFVIHYPAGDSSARGGVAGVDDNLAPGVETELRVLKEDLTFIVQPNKYPLPNQPPIGGEPTGKYFPSSSLLSSHNPVVTVIAEYTVENPTDKAITRSFGFPILRGEYQSRGVDPGPQYRAMLDDKVLNIQTLDIVDICGAIRLRAFALVREALDKDLKLNSRVITLRYAGEKTRQKAEDALIKYLVEERKWRKEDAALLAAYARIDFFKTSRCDDDYRGYQYDPEYLSYSYYDREQKRREIGGFGPLIAIGDQRATLFMTQLAQVLDPKRAASYGSFFKDWGGDVREQSLDMRSGKLRPREITGSGLGELTLYARVDYFNEHYKLTAEQVNICKSVLKNLPVTFTYAPMNILRFQAVFPPKSTSVLAVSYNQFAYTDSEEPATCQFNYVIHPSKHWQSFGPINISVLAPNGVKVRASTPLADPVDDAYRDPHAMKQLYDAYKTELKDKPDFWYMAFPLNTWKETKPKIQEVPK